MLVVGALPCGCVLAMWVCSCHVGVSLPCGYIITMWVCHCHVGVSLPCGCVTTLWMCHYHVGVSLPCGCVTTLWWTTLLPSVYHFKTSRRHKSELSVNWSIVELSTIR